MISLLHTKKGIIMFKKLFSSIIFIYLSGCSSIDTSLDHVVIIKNTQICFKTELYSSEYSNYSGFINSQVKCSDYPEKQIFTHSNPYNNDISINGSYLVASIPHTINSVDVQTINGENHIVSIESETSFNRDIITTGRFFNPNSQSCYIAGTQKKETKCIPDSFY